MTEAVPERWLPLADYAGQCETDAVRIGLAIQAPDGDSFSFRGAERFHAASTIKLPIVLALLRQVDRGKRSLEERHDVQWSDVDLDVETGARLELSQGVPLPLQELMYMAISMSDNDAANILIDVAGMDNVNDTMTELGMHQSELGRKILGRPAYPEEGNRENWTTPDDLRILIDAILNGQAASAQSCAMLIDMLAWQRNPKRIGAPFAKGSLPWGSKTGTVSVDSHDAGFVRGPRGDMVIAVCTTGFSDWRNAESVIAKTARLAGVACGLLPVGSALPKPS